MSEEEIAKNSTNWNTDRVVGLSAMFISVLTLITFIYQTKLMQKQAKLSVLPYLSVSSSYNTGDEPSFKLILINEGVGPAIIESRKVFYKGEEYDVDFFDFLAQQIPGLDSTENISHASFNYGSILPAGEDLYLIAAFGDRGTVDFLAASLQEMNTEDLDYEIVYRSIYGERWKVTNARGLPNQLADAK